MAKASDTKKKKSTSSSASSRKKSTGSTKQAATRQPRRREILALIFFFIAVFLAVGLFVPEGTVIIFGTDLVKTLVGFGFWLTIPAFLFSALRRKHTGR